MSADPARARVGILLALRVGGVALLALGLAAATAGAGVAGAAAGAAGVALAFASPARLARGWRTPR